MGGGTRAPFSQADDARDARLRVRGPSRGAGGFSSRPRGREGKRPLFVWRAQSSRRASRLASDSCARACMRVSDGRERERERERYERGGEGALNLAARVEKKEERDAGRNRAMVTTCSGMLCPVHSSVSRPTTMKNMADRPLMISACSDQLRASRVPARVPAHETRARPGVFCASKSVPNSNGQRRRARRVESPPTRAGPSGLGCRLSSLDVFPRA